MAFLFMISIFLVPPSDTVLVHEDLHGGADSSISADGRWIAFSSRRSGNMDLWIVDTSSGELRQLTRHRVHSAARETHSRVCIIGDIEYNACSAIVSLSGPNSQ